MVSLSCELLCIHSIYTWRAINGWQYGEQNLNWNVFLLLFLYSNSKFIVTCKNGDFECWYIWAHSEEKSSKISNITFAILPFSHQNTLTKLLSWALWSFKIVHSNTKNAKHRVPQSQVCYLRTINSSTLLVHSWFHVKCWCHRALTSDKEQHLARCYLFFVPFACLNPWGTSKDL